MCCFNKQPIQLSNQPSYFAVFLWILVIIDVIIPIIYFYSLYNILLVSRQNYMELQITWAASKL